MNKKILLALLPPWGDCSSAPLGIPCITSKLVKSGYDVIQKDYHAAVYSKIILNFNRFFSDPLNLFYEGNYDKNIFPFLRHFVNKWAGEIIESGASIIGFTAYCTNIYTIKRISKIIKAKDPGKIIVIGGPEANRGHMECEYLDFAVIGDGENTLHQLVEEIFKSSPDYKKVKGLVYKDKESREIIYTGDSMPACLDDLPFPDFKDIDFKAYKYEAVPVEGSRGCINRCSFCIDVVLRKYYRYKSGGKIFEEIRHYAGLGHRYFSFVDSLINGNLPELEKFCDLVIESKLNGGEKKIHWTSNACIRRGMTPELLVKMKKAGCHFLNYGLESASDDVLKMMNKRITSALAAEVIKNTYLAGIEVRLFMIVGFPTETEKNFEETLNFIALNREYINHIYAGGGCVVLQDSDLDKNPEKYGIYWANNETGVHRILNWRSKESTLEIRKERLNRFVGHCRSLKIECESIS